MDVLIDRCAGLDIHRDTVVACARTPGTGGSRVEATATFGTTTGELQSLRAWLVNADVTVVGMESTSVYWRPVYFALEDRFDCQLLNPVHLRRVPGRKTDVSDAAWICQITEHGLVTPSFVPPPLFRQLRSLTRYRRAQIEERTREVQRLDKVLQDAGIKLSSVATDILGVSGRAMIEALIAGERDPDVLSNLARRSMRKKIPLLGEALVGRFDDNHALMLGQMLANLDHLDAAIAAISARIEELQSPFAAQLELLSTVPGVKTKCAQVIIAEVGVDMVRFGSASRLASWAGLCPGNNESGGKKKGSRQRHGNKWLGTYLAEAAQAAGKTDTFLGARYRRLRARRGPSKATKAVAHSILVAAFYIIRDGVPFNDLGADWFDRRRPEHRARQLVHQLNTLGYTVRLDPIEAA